ncbi:MAG TPA: sodium:solute symporter family protein [Acidobacteriota bacterium]
MTVALWMLALYAAALIAVGLLVGRWVRASGDFFVAGRTLPAGLVFVTLLAANIGAGSTVGATGLGYSYGLSAWWWVGSAGIGSILFGLLVAPKIHRLAATHGYLTVGDFLEARYDRGVRGLVSLVLWFASLAGLSGQLIAMAAVLQVAAGVPKLWGCLLGGLIMIAYYSSGGLRSAVWVNLLELVVVMAGFAVALPYAIGAAGGWTALEGSAAGRPEAMSLLGGPIFGWLIVLVPSFLISPGLIQKTYGAASAGAARRAVLWNAAALLLFAAIPPLLGLSIRAARPALANPDLALPTLMTELLPLWLGGLVLGAVFAAEISSADAFLFMLSTSLSQDLYKTFVRPSASDARLLQVSRRTSVVAGLLGVAAAILLPGVIAALTLFYSILTVSLLVPLLAGLYTTGPRPIDAKAAILLSAATFMIGHFVCRGTPAGAWLPVSLAILVSLSVFARGWWRAGARARFKR